MQGVFSPSPDDDVMDKPTQDRFNRVDQDIRDVNESLKETNRQLYQLGQDVGEIKGAIKPRADVHWGVRFLLAPALLLLISGSVGIAYRSIDKRLDTIETFVHENGGFLVGLRLQQNASNPTSPQSVAEAKQVLSTAKTARVKIPQNIVDDLGKKYVEATDKNPQAWGAALEFMGYKSFLNVDHAPPLKPSRPVKKDNTAYAIPVIPGARIGTMIAVGYSKFPDVPQLRVINEPDLNRNATNEPERLEISDTDVLLDNVYAKNIVFVNSRIIYHSGRVMLDNVYFINCTFDLEPRPNGQSFATKFLESGPAATFSAG